MLQQPISAQNAILRSLPTRAAAILRPKLTHVQIKRRTLLQEPQGSVDNVYFIESGMVAVSTRTPQDGEIQIRIVGRFGLIGVPALLGTGRSPTRCVMELDGAASMCWCQGVEFPASLLARVPAAARDQTCICRACAVAAATSPQGAQR